MNPKASDSLVTKLAIIAAHAKELMALDHPTDKAPIGLTTMKNERRRTAEAMMILLADAEVRDYLAELKRLGFVTKS